VIRVPKDVGVVTHFFNHLSVAVVKVLDGELKKGDRVRFHGHTTDFEQVITSIQAHHRDLESAKEGMEVGVKVDQPVRAHDKVTVL